jgi:hypothetical protein
MAEMISNGDGEKKQDCELAAGKRWINRHGEAVPASETDPFGG